VLKLVAAAWGAVGGERGGAAVPRVSMRLLHQCLIERKQSEKLLEMFCFIMK
jgi:hypothetical protein